MGAHSPSTRHLSTGKWFNPTVHNYAHKTILLQGGAPKIVINGDISWSYSALQLALYMSNWSYKVTIPKKWMPQHMCNWGDFIPINGVMYFTLFTTGFLGLPLVRPQVMTGSCPLEGRHCFGYSLLGCPVGR